MVGKEQLSWATECHYRTKSGVKSMHEERASEHSSSQGTDMGLSQGLALTAALATADCKLGPAREALSDQTVPDAPSHWV